MSKVYDYDFDLPTELIAQFPTKNREESRLLIAQNDPYTSPITQFFQITDYLKSGDLLVFNNSRVINAQLFLPQNNSSISVNLNKPLSENTWSGFAKPAKKLKIGDIFSFGKHQIIIQDKLDFGEIILRFELHTGDIFQFLDQYGHVPLPQYIKRNDQSSESQDKERYQTVYNKDEGSVAAPTAGLHFSDGLIAKIKEKNVEMQFVTLHVGGGTFLPIRSENIDEHKMHEEWCQVPQITADAINRAKREGRRVILVGTTTMRTIESCSHQGLVVPQTKKTDIFITPGYKFQIADAMITNFHLPKSTLFMLVCAFSGTDYMKNLYQHAIRHKMRFFSYGDAMIITRK